MNLETSDPVVQKVKTFIEKYEKEYSNKPLHLAVSKMLTDQEYFRFTTEEKVILALLIATVSARA